VFARRSRRPQTRGQWHWTVRVAVVLLMVVAVSCRRRHTHEPDFGPTRGIILISIDTLRADHLSCYGYPRQTSPFLDSLAARGVLFEHVFAQMPNTLTSHMTALTGLYPAEHDVYPPDGVLSPQIPLLAEILQQAGYRTGGVTEGGYMKGSYGFSRGFDSFSDTWRPWGKGRSRVKQRRLEDTLAQGLDFLRTVPAGQRFFLFLHTYVVHAPYDPPAPFDTVYWDAPRPPVFAPTGPGLARFNQVGGSLPRHAVDYFRALYDGEIRYADDRLRAFFSRLDEMGLSDDLTVIVMSDHGEEFLEHGGLEHFQLYRETIHVPLIVVYPRLRAGRRVAEPVELVDLTPTICSLTGIPCPQELSGRSLARELRGKGRLRQDVEAYSEMYKGAEQTLIRDDGRHRYQLVVSGVAPGAWLGRQVTFDLQAGHHTFDIKSYGKPRRVAMSVDGARQEDLALTTAWRTVTLPVGRRGRRQRVRLRAEGCQKVRKNLRRMRCLAFAIRNPSPRKVELFDMAADPGERRDVSLLHPEVVRRLVARLRRYDREPHAVAGHLELSSAQDERLQALGYLN
jgi:arylsulfatase A-like enzyme